MRLLLQHGIRYQSRRAAALVSMLMLHHRYVKSIPPQLLLPQQSRYIFLIVTLLLLPTMIQSMHDSPAAFDLTKKSITKLPDWTNQRNPYEEGCLYSHGLQSIPRTCNSDDTDTSKCSKNDMQYMEIRIHTGDWESITYESWIIQILLSELLHVPTTIDAGMLEDGVTLNFYNNYGDLSYGKYSLYDAISTAYFSEHGDCVPIMQKGKGIHPNVTCAHVVPESWRGTFSLDQWLNNATNI